MPPEPAFILGMMVGSIITLFFLRYRRVKRTSETLRDETKQELARLADQNDRQIVALKGRIATLERISTGPAERTARAIDALR